MFTYALRCIEIDYPTLVANAKILGALPSDYSVLRRDIYDDGERIWDYIGYKELEGGGYLVDGLGNKYVHVNARIPFNVRERAQALAIQYPAIASGLADIDRYFITDAEGNYVWPVAPMRVFL